MFFVVRNLKILKRVKKLFSSSILKIGENSWIEGEMFNIIYCKLWKICELWYDGSRRNFIEAFLTKLVKSKDARSRSIHKISIVTHATVASIVAGRGSHKAPLFSWARIPKSPLSRSGYTIGEGLRFGSIKQCHCFRVSLFLQTCCFSCAFSSKRFEREGKTNHSISVEIFQLGIRFASTSSKEDETRIIRFLYWFWRLEM